MLRNSLNLIIALGVLFVLVLVFVVGWPFAGLRLFSTQERLSVHSTALVIEKIRDIAELSTAEYYGEVICTLDSAITDEIQSDLEKNYRRINFIYQGLYNDWKLPERQDLVAVELFRPGFRARAYEELVDNAPVERPGDLAQFCAYMREHDWETYWDEVRQKDLSRRTLRKIEDMQGSYGTLRERYIRLYEDTSLHLPPRARLAAQSFKQLELSRTPSYVGLRNLVSRLEDLRTYDDDDTHFLELLRTNGWTVDEFRQMLLNNNLSFQTAEEEVRQLRESKARLAYIGRGVVRAGFRLDSLSEDAISLRSDRDTLEVLIFPDKLYPVLLDTILNPWFVPPSRVSMASDGSYQYEGGIRGFQVVFLENHRQISQRDVGLVKQSCKNQLADQALAMQPNILEEASESARQILASWLSLLEPDKVVVVNIAAAN